MLANIWEPFRFIIGILESVVVFIGSLFVAGTPIELPGDYFTQLNRAGIFADRAQDAKPQTAVYSAILAFFEEDHGGKTPKCLVIGYDGARADALINTKDDPGAGTQMLKAEGGAIYNMYTGGEWLKFNFQDTSTAPGWMTLVTGHWAKEKGGTGHGVNTNAPTKPANGPKTIFVDLLEKGLASKTSYIVSWGKHFTGEDASYANDMLYTAAKGLQADWITHPNDAGTFAATLAEVEKDDNADMIMCILEYCDSAGHNSAFSNRAPRYVQSIKDSERDAAALINAVKARDSYASEEWLIIITADHGGVYTGHGPQFAGCRQVFLAANKKIWG